MEIFKNEIPILEYDPNPKAVLEPGHEKLGIVLPQKAIFAFLGEEIDRFAKENGGEKLGEFVTISGTIPVYRVKLDGESLCLAKAPVGAAVAAEMLDWLIAYGVDEIVCAGSCGALIDLPENTFLIPEKALRDEGTSYHYLPPARYVTLHKEMQDKIASVMEQEGISCLRCNTWSTDGIYRETAGMVAYRRAEGCSVVEMECAALAACAEFRGVRFGQFLYTADTLADAACYDERDWGDASVGPALRLCLKIALEESRRKADDF